MHFGKQTFPPRPFGIAPHSVNATGKKQKSPIFLYCGPITNGPIQTPVRSRFISAFSVAMA
jgi:hypothetical protein